MRHILLYSGAQLRDYSYSAWRTLSPKSVLLPRTGAVGIWGCFWFDQLLEYTSLIPSRAIQGGSDRMQLILCRAMDSRDSVAEERSLSDGQLLQTRQSDMDWPKRFPEEPATDDPA